MSNEGKLVSVHYVGTVDDGTVFDSSRMRGEPLQFVCMAGMMIPGFDKAVCDMEIGETKNIHLEPEEAYGDYNEDLVHKVPQMLLPGADKLEVGMMVTLTNPNGIPMAAIVIEKDERSVTFDCNHPLAGEALNFEIELLDSVEYEGGCPGCAGCGDDGCSDECAGCGDDDCSGCSGC